MPLVRPLLFLQSLSALQKALAVSVLVHAAVLTVRFADPVRFDRIFQDTPIEVVLVNAKSKDKPEKAKAIAQASLAGGGELDTGRATSPLPPSTLTSIGDAAEDALQRVEALQAEQTQLLAQIRKELAILPLPDPAQATNSPADVQKEEKRRQLLQILAEIERRVNEENARPKKRYISPATREEVYAIYYDALRRRIEEKGSVNFPEAAGKKMYGELTMMVTVNFDGRVLATEVVSTSGNLVLDRRAQSIVRSTGPFDRFSEAMRRKADQIVVVSRFNFTRDDALQTRLIQQ